jgi:BNR repeat-like domain/Putative zinc- or iron-chelating domain
MRSRLVRCALPLALGALCLRAAPEPPRMLMEGPGTATSLLRRPDGSFAFYDRRHPDAGPVVLPDREGRRHTLLPALSPALAGSKIVRDSGVLDDSQLILTPDGHLISVRVRGEKLDPATARQVGLSYHLDLWLTRADARTADPARRIWSGYNGSQMEVQAGPGGRIFVPFGSMIPHAKAVPPTGRHETIVLYSDDGRTWQQSAARLVAPCYEGFNGSNEGACEPTLEPLRDGRLWMLMRTQAGFLYESTSRDNGTTWSAATASRFNTSTGPANLLRHRNGWLVLTWNNCEMPRRADGEGVYGGRDALHIAVSTDEGATWRGFREIYLDFRRNENPAKSGDRGSAYPLGAYMDDGRIVVIAGQGAGGRNPVLIDPDWIVETRARTDFSDGLASWSTYKHHGPARRWWRARAVGGELVPDPENPAARSLHLRKHDDLPADAAVWNFPNGWKGSLTARVRVRPGFAGGMICLNDRFFDPSECDRRLRRSGAHARSLASADAAVGPVRPTLRAVPGRPARRRAPPRARDPQRDQLRALSLDRPRTRSGRVIGRQRGRGDRGCLCPGAEPRGVATARAALPRAGGAAVAGEGIGVAARSGPRRKGDGEGRAGAARATALPKTLRLREGKAVKPAEDLCRACGLCCDGTLFDVVKLEAGDDARKLSGLGLPITVSRGKAPVARFPQPCAALCADRSCRLYANRPWQCRTFECRTLKEAKAGEVTFADGLRTVKQARRRAD